MLGKKTLIATLLASILFLAGTAFAAVQWDPDTLLTTNDNSDYTAQSNQHNIVIDNQGRIHIVWWWSRPYGAADRNEIRYKRYTPGFGWSDDTTLTPEAIAGNHSYPSLALDPSGVLHLVWQHIPSGANYNIYYNTCNPVGTGNGGWGTPQIISVNPVSYRKFYPNIACSPNGNIHVVWRERAPISPPTYYIAYREKTGAGWQTEVRIDSSTTDKNYPAVVCDQNNNVHITWQRVTAPTQIMYRARIGGSWQSIEAVSGIATADQTYPSIAINTATNNPHIVWYSAGTPQRIVHKYRTTTWSEAETLGVTETYNQAYPQIVSRTDSTMHCIWNGYSVSAGTYSKVRYAERAANGVWSTPENLTPELPDIGRLYPSITTDTAKHLYIVWQQWDGTDFEICYKHGGPLAAPAVTVIAPNGGELWTIGSTQSITWNNTGGPSALDSILYSTDNGSSWLFIKDTFGITSDSWLIPNTPTTQARVKIKARNAAGVSEDQSDNPFTIGYPAPTLTGVDPNSGNRLQTLDVVLTGTNFISGVSSVDFGPDITINSTTVNSPTQITANITISASAATGPRDVSVTNSGPGGGTATLPNGFTVGTGGGGGGERWEPMASIPTEKSGKSPKSGSCMVGSEATNRIYFLKASNTQDFNIYTIDPNGQGSWTTETMPLGTKPKDGKKPKKGASIAAYGDYVYVLRGNNTPGFWRYKVTDPTGWETLPSIPPGTKNPKDGSGMVAVTKDGNPYLFVMKGSKTTEFYLYDITNKSWSSALTAPPTGPSGKTGYKKGSCLAYDGDTWVYVMKGQYGDFFRYNLSNGIWDTTLKHYNYKAMLGRGNKKKKIGEGSGLVYHNGILYLLKGGNTREVWFYDTTWKLPDDTLWDIPAGPSKKRVKGGGALIKFANFFWASKGNNTPEFYRHGLPSPVIADVTPTPTNEGVTGKEVATSEFKLTIVPNPAINLTAIRYTLPVAGPINFKLYNVAGAVVKTYSNSTPTKDGVLLLDTEALPSGVYILRFNSGDIRVTRKIVLEK
ncbi:MAG: BNR-4 repeat-containing protein [candidate division WOR-3 bacterium]